MISPRKLAALALATGLASASAPAQQNPGLTTRPYGAKLPALGKRTDSALPADAAAEAQIAEMIEATSEEEQYTEAVKQGHAWAFTRLGVLYARAENDPERWKSAVALLEKAGEKKDPEALFQLAMMARAGRGMPASDTAAFDYCWRAAELGMPLAQYELASMYAQGLGTVKNEDAAINWARKAADQGHEEAQFSVGRVLIESRDSDAQAEAIRRLESAASKDNSRATIFLATVLARGDFGVRKDEAKAERLLKHLADNGDAESQMALASLYKIGESFADKRKLSEEWLRRAAAGGNQKAAEILRADSATESSQ